MLLFVAVVVEAVEAIGVLLASVLAGIDTASGRSYQASSGLALTIIGVGAAVFLGLVALGLFRARRWTRTPALMTQLFVAIVGIYLLQGARIDWGLPAVVLAAAGFGALLAPASWRALVGEHSGNEQERAPEGARRDSATPRR